MGITQSITEDDQYRGLEYDEEDDSHNAARSLNSSYTVSMTPARARSSNSKTPLMLDGPKSPTSSNNSASFSTSTSGANSPTTPTSSTSFNAEYYLEHSVDVDNDTVAGLCLRYDIDRRETINSVHSSSKITGDGGLNDLFHIEALFVPVQFKNVGNVISYLNRASNNNNNNNNNNNTMNKNLSSGSGSNSGTLAKKQQQQQVVESDMTNISDSILSLFHDEVISVNSSRTNTEQREMILHEFYAPEMTPRMIQCNNIVQLEWISTDSLRGKFSIGVNLFHTEMAARIQQTMKIRENTITDGFLVYEKNRVMPTFFTTKNNPQFFEVISQLLSSMNIQVRNNVNTLTFR